MRANVLSTPELLPLPFRSDYRPHGSLKAYLIKKAIDEIAIHDWDWSRSLLPIAFHDWDWSCDLLRARTTSDGKVEEQPPGGVKTVHG